MLNLCALHPANNAACSRVLQMLKALLILLLSYPPIIFSAPISPPVIISAGHLTNQTMVIRTLPVNLVRPVTLSCIFKIGSNTYKTNCDEVTIIEHKMKNWQECLFVSAAISTMGGSSRWSKYSEITRIPIRPSIRTVKKSLNLLTESDKKVQTIFRKLILDLFFFILG